MNFVKRWGTMARTTRKRQTLLGLMTGLINGAFGGGGGMFAVPMLIDMGKEQHDAQATAMALILPMTVATAVAYVWRAGITWQAIWAALGSIPGAWLGARWMGRMRSVWLSRLFAAFALLAGIRMLLL